MAQLYEGGRRVVEDMALGQRGQPRVISREKIEITATPIGRY